MIQTQNWFIEALKKKKVQTQTFAELLTDFTFLLLPVFFIYIGNMIRDDVLYHIQWVSSSFTSV